MTGKKSKPLTVSPEEAKIILEWRKKHDPIPTYAPGPVQKACLESRAQYRLLQGPNRGGKTAAAAVELAMCARKIHPHRTSPIPGRYLVFADRREQIRDVWYAKLRKHSELKGPCYQDPMIPGWEVESEHFIHGAGEKVCKSIKLRNGHMIEFYVSGTKDAFEALQGKGRVLGAFIDEAAGTQELLDEIFSRFLDMSSNEEVTKAAGRPFFLWSYSKTMVNPAGDDLEAKAVLPEFPDIELFTIPAGENPAIKQEERERLRGVISDEAYATRMEGTGSALGAMLVYPQFSPVEHVLTSDYYPTDQDTLYIGYDPGTNYSGIVFAAIRREEPYKLYVYRVLQPRRQSLQADAADIANVLRGRFFERLVYDQAARKLDKSANSTVAFQLERMLKGLGVRWRGCFTKGDSIYERGVPTVRSYLAPMKDLDRLPALLVMNPGAHTGCPILKQQFMTYRFTDSAQALKGDGIVRGNDHCLDALRYLIGSRPAWVDRGPNPENPAWADVNKQDARVLSEDEFRHQEQVRISTEIASGAWRKRRFPWRYRGG